MAMFGSDSWFAPVSSAAGNVLSTGWNVFSTLKNWQRQDRINQIMWDRDDNAVQRRVADLKAAGLSPVLAAGSAAGNSAAAVGASPNSIDFDPAGRYLSAVQQKADISKTNAGTALTNFQAFNEKLRGDLIKGQKSFLDEQIQNLSLQNAWFTSNQLAKLALSNSQTDKNRKEIEKISSEINLTNAKTALTQSQNAYQTTSMDLLKTQIDNEKILRDINFQNRLFNPYKTMSGIFANAGGLGKIINLGIGAFTGLSAVINGIDDFMSDSFDRHKFWDYYPK